MSHSVFVSNSSKDHEYAARLTAELERHGLRCWIAPRDIRPGGMWGEEIQQAIARSQAFVVLVSSSSNASAQVPREVDFAVRQRIPVIPIRLEDVQPSRALEYFLSSLNWIDAFGRPIGATCQTLISALRRILPQSGSGDAVPVERSEEPLSKGYVFLSYVRSDGDFVLRLRTILKHKGYAYWDYLDAERDYHGALYRELEERIDQAKAFITIVSDGWRKSDWIAAEYIYAKEAQKPIFVVQASVLTRPMPILLNLQTRIDMSGDFEESAGILQRQLEKKGL